MKYLKAGVQMCRPTFFCLFFILHFFSLVLIYPVRVRVVGGVMGPGHSCIHSFTEGFWNGWLFRLVDGIYSRYRTCNAASLYCNVQI